MQLSKGATVAVVDGQKLSLFHNEGEGLSPKLTPAPSSGQVDLGRSGGSAEPREIDEDDFTAGVAAFLNRQVLEGHVASLLVIAAPKALGMLRKHYHQKLTAVLVGEIAKDLTGQTSGDIEHAIAAA